MKYDLGIIIGGDGTLLYTNFIMNGLEMPPILCFDAGTLGFLCEHQISSTNERIHQIHEHFCSGIPFRLEKRTRVNGAVYKKEDGGKVSYAKAALNDIVIERSSTTMVRFEVEIDGVHATSLGADGLLLSSSTGSTAYNISINGPIIQNDVECLILNSIAPFSISTRPVVFGGETVLRIKLAQGNRGAARIVFDGQCNFPIENGDEVVVVLDRQRLNLIPSPNAEESGSGALFVKKLRELFGWK